MSVMKNTKEKMSREALEGAVAAARAELAKRRAALAAAEEARMFAEAVAAKGSWIEKRAFRTTEDAVERLEDAVIEAEALLREREAELESYLAESEQTDGAADARWLKIARKRAAELERLDLEKSEEVLSIRKKRVALAIEAARRTPKKLVARRSLRIVRVEVLDEATKAVHGEKMNLEFFTAKRAEKAGKVRIIPDENLTIKPEDIEYQKQDVPLPLELETIRSTDLGRLFPREDANEELSYNRIAATLTENEKVAAVKAVEEGA